MRLVDRLLTIVITITLTSVAWIVIGSFYLQRGPAAESRTPRHGAVNSCPSADHYRHRRQMLWLRQVSS